MLVAMVTAPKRAGPGDDLRFFVVLAGIEHLVRDAALQHARPGGRSAPGGAAAG